MANGLKRMLYAEEAGFQKRVAYYYWLRSSQILLSQDPDPTALAFAKAVYAERVSRVDMCLSVITDATIGAAIDAGTVPSDASLEDIVITQDRYSLLAIAYAASGLIGV